MKQSRVNTRARQDDNLKKQQDNADAYQAKREAAIAKKARVAVPKAQPPPAQNVTVTVDRYKTQHELLGEVFDRQHIAAEATKGMIQRLGESKSDYEARRKSAVDAAIRAKASR
jgi:hypothetical protein